MKKEELLTKIQKAIGEPDTNGDYVNVGISKRTLDAYVDAVLPSLGEDVSDKVIDLHVDIIKAMGGQLRHEKAEFAKNYKPTVEPKKEPQEPKKEPTELKNGSEVEKLLEQLNELKTRFDNQEKSSKQERLREKVIAGMKGKNATDEYVLKTCMKNVQLDDSKTVDDLVDECLGLYDAEYKECRSGNEPPRTGNNAGGSDKDIDSFFEEMKKRGKI